MNSKSDHLFSDSISRIYEQHLVPLIFEPYATDLATRLVGHSVSRVLEVAAGTGVATRSLARVLAQQVSIIASDLNQPMLDRAAAIGTSRPVTWRQADVMRLPFDDAEFDAVVCQFGVMFFPEKALAFSEVRRVLKPGGVFLFSVWDKIEDNEFADTVTRALARLHPADPPRFLARTPHGYYDPALIQRDLAHAGFTTAAEFATVSAQSRADSAQIPALAYCQGTPLRNEIEARGLQLEAATRYAAEAVAQQFGAGAVEGKIQAHVFTISQ